MFISLSINLHAGYLSGLVEWCLCNRRTLPPSFTQTFVMSSYRFTIKKGTQCSRGFASLRSFVTDSSSTLQGLPRCCYIFLPVPCTTLHINHPPTSLIHNTLHHAIPASPFQVFPLSLHPLILSQLCIKSPESCTSIGESRYGKT